MMRSKVVRRLRRKFRINSQNLIAYLQQQHANRMVIGKRRATNKSPTKYRQMPNKRMGRAGIKMQESKEDKK